MYAAELDGKRLVFNVSGMLWQRSLVMQDGATKSLWSHHLGRAMRGELEGTALEIIPSTITTWASWQKRQPETTAVLYRRTARQFERDFQSKPGRFVLGLAGDDAARAYLFERVAATGVVNDVFQGKAVLVTYDSEGASANAFRGELPGKPGITEEFHPAEGGEMLDRSTGSRWDRQSGRCVAGKLAGEQLAMLPAVPSFAKAWRDFHPETTVFGE